MRKNFQGTKLSKKTEKTLTIQIGDGPGLGDNLFYSHLPRIAKTAVGEGCFDKVYINNPWGFRHNDYKRLIWELNPYVDGVFDSPIQSPTQTYAQIDENPLFFRAEFSHFSVGENLLDKIMLFHRLDDGERLHEPEIYYQPKFRAEFHKVIFDPNWISNNGGIDFNDVLEFFKKQGIKIEAVMKTTSKNGKSDKKLFNYDIDVEFIQTPTLEDFCDLIFSAKAIYCFVTGTATLCAALKKPAHIIAGTKSFINPIFLHSKLHHYHFLNKITFTPHRILRYKFLGIKGHIRLSLKNFERMNSFFKSALPKSAADWVNERLNSLFKMHPTKISRRPKKYYQNLIKEIFVPKFQ